jgi:hypothetical protein
MAFVSKIKKNVCPNQKIRPSQSIMDKILLGLTRDRMLPQLEVALNRAG